MSCLLEQRHMGDETVAAVTGAAVFLPLTEIPDTWEGLPVRILGARAFAGDTTLKEIVIPDSVRVFENFVFHNCKQLRRMTLTDTVTEYGDGVIRACTALRDIDLTMQNENYTLIARMLSDSDYTMTFHLRLPEAEAVLTFPGFVYDFTENTMARTIQFNIEGSGMAFRECVSRTGIDFDAYDRMFERAKLDDIPIITAILTGRLMYPCGLSMQAASRYEAYLRAHEERILSYLIEIKDRAAVRFLTGRRLLSREALAHTAPFAASSGDAQIAALLSSYAASLRTEQEDAKNGASKGSLTI